MIFQNAVWKAQVADKSKIQTYSRIFDTEPLMTRLLMDRGFKTKIEVDKFFKPSLHDLHDPFLLEGMAIATARIQKAIEAKEEIWIYGDYDVDGITSISVMCKFFEHMGLPVKYYIPDRHDEGYGISIKGIDYIKESKGTLIITVDSGITAVTEVAYANSLGIDTIITDHHECQETLPDALSIINPKIGSYPFKMLCGCGVAAKLIQAMLGEAFYAFAPEILDIIALGTVADIVPLEDENRIYTKLGLQKMQSSTNPGIRALVNEANLAGKEINAGHIGFVIAPRINASGRIGDPKIAVEMLLSKDEEKAGQIAKQLSALNSDRQSREKIILDSAEEFIKNEVNLEEEKILLICGEDWHTGIIGIVASKLSDRYSRPVVILNIESGVAKGSARSVEGISIFEILSQFKSIFQKFGGHEQAAGLTLDATNIDALRSGLLDYSRTSIAYRELINKKRSDGVLLPQMVNHKLIEEIDALKPFGLGNPKPQFVFEALKLEDFKVIGKEKTHLKLIVNDGIRVYDALFFNSAHLAPYLKKQETLHLLLNLEINHFMGVETIQFMVKDLVKSFMPMKTLIELKLAKAITNYLKVENGFGDEYKFTSVSDFDIIFSVPQNRTLLVYTLESIIRLKDYVFEKNLYNYTIHFNEIDEKELIDGHLNILFMPFSTTISSLVNPVALLEPLLKNSIAIHVPNRNDLTHFYKNTMNLDVFDLSVLSKKLNMSMSKCLLCLDLLVAMDLITYDEFGGRIELQILPKPSEGIKLEQLDLFQVLSMRWKENERRS